MVCILGIHHLKKELHLSHTDNSKSPIEWTEAPALRLQFGLTIYYCPSSNFETV